MKTRKRRISVWQLSAAAASLCGALSAQAAGESGWYVGAAVGQSTATDLGGIDGTLVGYGINGKSTVSRTDNAWKFLGGYQINRHFGIEGAYANLGVSTITSVVPALTITGLPATATGSGVWQVNNVWSVSALGYLPLAERISAFGKLGIANANANLTYTVSGTSISQSRNTTSPLYGVGLKFDFGGNVTMRGEFERYQNIGDSGTTGQSSVNVLSVGMQYQF